jgi:hypothetical protein
MVAIGAGAIALAACTGSQPFLRAGNPSSAEVAYAGDVASALPIARRHCAQFEKMPRLVETAGDTAYFDCVKP